MAKILGKGIDVSEWNGTVDWKKVKAAGISYAFLRIGYGDLTSQKDPTFETNYKNAKAAGIKLGGYWYSYCTMGGQSSDDVTDAKLEAKACLACIKGKKFDLPIYYDLEESDIAKKGKTRVTKIATTFCDAIKAGGYIPGIYANSNWFNNYLAYTTLVKKYSIWFAEWSDSAGPSKNCDVWQWTSDGKVSGVSGRVDMNYLYRTDFTPSSEIKFANCKIQLFGKKMKGRIGVIKNVQRVLKECGYDIAVTGVYDAKTEAALKKYQKKFKLPVTGDFDEATAISLFSLVAA